MKLAGLTAANTRALGEIRFPDVTLTTTTATFDVDAGLALVRLDEMMVGLPARGHPRASLHAVRRKLAAAAQAEHQARLDADAEIAKLDESDPVTDEPVSAYDPGTPTDDRSLPFDPIFTFLLDLGYPNLFEQTGDRSNDFTFICKGCGATVKRWERKAHHAHHRAQRKEEIEMAKTANSTKSNKPAKRTAADEGVPNDYLGDNGSFRPGMDARYKSDLVKSALGIADDKNLKKYGKENAVERLQARGWMKFLDIKRAAIANAEARKVKAAEVAKAKKDAQAALKAKKEQDAKAAAKAEADAEANGTPEGETAGVLNIATGEITMGTVKPDPKPTPRKRSARKVGGARRK